MAIKKDQNSTARPVTIRPRRKSAVGVYIGAVMVLVILAIGLVIFGSLQPRTPDNAGEMTDWRHHSASRDRSGKTASQLAPLTGGATQDLSLSYMRGTAIPHVGISDLMATSSTDGISYAYTDQDKSQESKTADELPIFKSLRSSRDQPIPKEVKELAEELTKDSTNDLQRAKALYNWITDNILYDVDEWKHITGGGETYKNDHDPQSVLERGTTVCAGYSWLFDAMAASVGLNSTFLIGDVRGYRGTPDDQLISAFKHAWNAVQIDGRWELLDSTWGARQINEPDGLYRERQSYYFSTPPQQMIFDHYPESLEWQLLADPLPDSESFQLQPNLKPTFFQHGLLLDAPFGSSLKASAAGGGILGLSAPEGTQVAATITPREGDGAQPALLAVRESGTQRAIIVQPQTPGDYLLRIYSRNSADTSFTCSADFAIKVE